MKAMRIHEYGGPDVLRYEEVAAPSLRAGQALVRVKAGSVNPVDWKIRAGAVSSVLKLELPVTLGGDLAGVVEEVSADVQGFAKGDEVVAFVGLTGAHAEFVAVDAVKLAHRPTSVNVETAAGLPLVGLTAWQALFGADLEYQGKRVFIHNGAGGVGGIAVQLAKLRGAYVIATASKRNAEYVYGLGADRVLDLRETHARSADLGELDVLLDLAGDSVASGLWPYVRKGGHVIRVSGRQHRAPESDELVVTDPMVQPNGVQLGKLSELVQQSKLRLHVAEVFPIVRLGDAHELSRTGRVRGKIALTF